VVGSGGLPKDILLFMNLFSHFSPSADVFGLADDNQQQLRWRHKNCVGFPTHASTVQIGMKTFDLLVQTSTYGSTPPRIPCATQTWELNLNFTLK